MNGLDFSHASRVLRGGVSLFFLMLTVHDKPWKNN